MKRQDLATYHHKTPTEIMTQIAVLEKELGEAKLRLKLNELKNLHQPKNIRRSIAQLNSIHQFKLLGQPIPATARVPKQPIEAKPTSKPKVGTNKTTSTKKKTTITEVTKKTDHKETA